MSVMRCEDCDRFVDTDFEEMVDVGNQRRLERWVCQRCAEAREDEREDWDDDIPVNVDVSARWPEWLKTGAREVDVLCNYNKEQANG